MLLLGSFNRLTQVTLDSITLGVAIMWPAPTRTVMNSDALIQSILIAVLWISPSSKLRFAVSAGNPDQIFRTAMFRTIT